MGELRLPLVSVLLLGILFLCANAPAQEGIDHKDIDLAKHGISVVKPTKDRKTGFIVGGKNTTAVIRGLTHINDISIADLERVMRPGKSSKAGFLGPKENLLDVLAADNDYVTEKLGLTHQELARHLHAMGVIAKLLARIDGKPLGFIYNGRRYQVLREDTRGLQPSPFEDGIKSGSNVTVKNLGNGKEI